MLAEPVADRDGARPAGALDPRALAWLRPFPVRGLGPVAPREPNGYKLERFVFDLLPDARALLMVEARREEIRLPPDSVALELDHSVIDGPEDAASLFARDAAGAASLIRMGPGVTP